ncbi:MAG: hypothetical protein U1E76_10715 [Planctomycetota bacterium]
MSWMLMILALTPAVGDPQTTASLGALGALGREALREHVGCMLKLEAELQDRRKAIREGVSFRFDELREGTRDRLQLLAELQVDEAQATLVRKQLAAAFDLEQRALLEHRDSEGGSPVLRAIVLIEEQRLSAAQQQSDASKALAASQPSLRHDLEPARGDSDAQAEHAAPASKAQPGAAAPDLLRAADNLYKLGKFAQARELYQQVPASPAIEAFLLYRRGECELRVDHYEQGIQLLTRASKVDPDNTWSKQAGRSLQIAESLRKLPKAPRGSK